ncbi:hypothetical protein F0562_035975 [Nyssa sinensis]|uniref:NAC domain-containing protein n=1 Tax=Nyssa sinensis TaxID=561372 RepID=A0A5J5ADA6_9ASTE|nr:hypothetical protein F0562_035975 [Nyssa sinensis]
MTQIISGDFSWAPQLRLTGCVTQPVTRHHVVRAKLPWLTVSAVTDSNCVAYKDTDVNPYLYMPSNLPDDFWYFIHSEEKKDSELGSWKTKGEACEIFVDSDIIGWRTTLEFYEGRAPHGQKTDWVMQEYRITCKRLCENKQQKESGSLCRVFLSGVQSSNHETHHKQVGAGSAGGNHLHSMPSVVPNADNTSGQGSLSEFQVKNRDEKTGPLTVAESLQNLPVEDLHENDYILKGDYMALDDLSSSSDYILRGDYMALDDLSSSSDNSSRLSLSSDECFDSLALLRDLEDEINQKRQGNDANFKFSVAESARSKEVVMSPATSGSLISSNGSKSPTEETLKTGCSPPVSAVKGKVPGERALKHEVKSQKTDHRREGQYSC